MGGKVLGCLEGTFAHGQVYVLISRVTDPRNLCLVGLPPADLLDEVAEAWAAHGLDVDACFTTAAGVSGDWEYTAAGSPGAAAKNVRQRLTRRETVERRVPVRLRSLAEVLDPQPETAAVLHRLLDWIDRADRAAQAGAPKPAFTTRRASRSSRRTARSGGQPTSRSGRSRRPRRTRTPATSRRSAANPTRTATPTRKRRTTGKGNPTRSTAPPPAPAPRAARPKAPRARAQRPPGRRGHEGRGAATGSATPPEHRWRRGTGEAASGSGTSLGRPAT